MATTTQEDTVNFEKRVLAFRGTFQRIEPFRLQHRCRGDVHQDGHQGREQQELLDLTPSALKELKDGRSDLKRLEQV